MDDIKQKDLSSLVDEQREIVEGDDNEPNSQVEEIKNEGSLEAVKVKSEETQVVESGDGDAVNPIPVTIDDWTDDWNMQSQPSGSTETDMDMFYPTRSSASPVREDPSVYHLKTIKWLGNKTPIITQNENGPCPLIAIMNVLLLKGRIQLPGMMELITSNQLMEYLGDCILNSVPKNIPETAQLNYEQNFQDAMSILPRLPKGLDVNVRFTGISEFEFTPECIIFDLLSIPLYHGWLFDPSEIRVKEAIAHSSYNQLVDKIIANKTSSQQELITEALIAEDFLEKTASQLTYFGLTQLIENLKEDELGVLFRNNHFITLLKKKDQLYQLVTDQGFLHETNVVWETLNNIEGDDQFVDGDFMVVPPKLISNPQQQIDQDYLVALSLQEEQKRVAESGKEWETFKHESGMEGLTDEELARKLQDEENSRFTAQRQQEEHGGQEGEQEQAQPQQEPVQQHSSAQQQCHQRGHQSQAHPQSGQSANVPSNPLRREQRERDRGSGSDSNCDSNGSNKSKSKNCMIM